MSQEPLPLTTRGENGSHGQSFSLAQRWNLSLNSLVLLASVLALVVMVNYLAARHFTRFSWSTMAQAELSPRSLQVLSLVTNELKVTLYFDKQEPLYDLSAALLRNYAFANPRIKITSIDYSDPGAAQQAKLTYKLSDQVANVVIFEYQGRTRLVYRHELSELDARAMMAGQSKEARRTHFKGEMEFTAAILSVLNPRQLKACLLEGHGEHRVESDDGTSGYMKFGGVLRENSVKFEPLVLETLKDVPADCNLLIIPGPRGPLLPETLEKIDRYLSAGGRAFVLFRYPPFATGLERLLERWGVSVGQNLVTDPKAGVKQNDMVISTYGSHDIVKPLHEGFGLYLILPRTIEPLSKRGVRADAPQVDPLFYSSKNGRVVTDIRGDGTPYLNPNDVVTNVALAVAVEKGGVRGVSADRGTTRLVVTGDSLFLANDNLDTEANHQFASQVINWLLARKELISGLGPRPILEYKLTMTVAQERGLRWILMGAMPGAVLVVGFFVWLRRRR